MPTIATATVEKRGGLPTLSAGKVTPEVYAEFVRLSKAFFREKDVAATRQVARISGALTDSGHVEWYDANETNLESGDFNAFCTAFRAKFVSNRDDHKLQTTLYSSKQGDRDFLDWAQDVCRINRLIIGSDAHLSDSQLSHILRGNCDTELLKKIGTVTLDADPSTDLQGWIDEIQTLHEELAEERARIRRMMEAMLKTAKRVATPNAAPASTSTLPARNSQPREGTIPKLTEAEKQLLSDNQGCFKCRRVFQDHMSRDCPNGFPKKHYAITQALVDRFRPKATPTAAAAAVDTASSSAAPIGFSSVLEDAASDTEYVPFDSPTYTIPAVISDLHTEVFIDNGCSTVLIDEDLVRQLNARRRPFSQKQKLGLATKGQSVETAEWVTIEVELCERKWKSVIMRAKVVRGLFRPVILGTPFLNAHQLVHDFGAQTLIDPATGLNLLEGRILPTPPVEAKTRRASQPSKTPPPTDVRYFSIVPKQQKWSAGHNITAAMTQIRTRIEELAHQEEFDRREAKIRQEFADRFPTRLPDVDTLPRDVYHRIRLKDANQIITARQYQTPKKYKEAWKRLLQGHLDAGRLRPSSSNYSSPAFLIAKPGADDPRWVNDYRRLNSNTVRDQTPLPRIDDILADCGKGKIFGKIDMTNAFYQTRVHPDDIHLTAIATPLGLYEWTVLPLGGTNGPATHQRRMYQALREHIGVICHIYIDDIIIWSQDIEEHERNIRTVLQALRDNHLVCSSKKTKLFATRLEFLGHIVSSEGIQADPGKVEKLANWPTPKNSTEVRAFLGLLRYIAMFLPALAEHTTVLNRLTTKEADKDFPEWNKEYQEAFEAIKTIVLSSDCLTVIDYDSTDNEIFVTTDASDRRLGAVLAFGKTWDTARPVAFESRQLRPAEKSYPTHEKEMLAIVHALKKWRSSLLGYHFHVYTDHRTLEYFDTQKDLSRRQLRWAEFLSQYDYDLHYIKGEENTVADALSRLPDEELETTVATTVKIEADQSVVKAIQEGYTEDPWCVRLQESKEKTLGVEERDGLLFVGNRLVIPRNHELREQLYQAAHDVMGHFGFDKSYAALRDSYFWPNMREDLEKAYIPSCSKCQRNKSRTSAPAGPLHPLPIPEQRGDSVAIDFIGPLPEDSGFNAIVTMTDRLGGSDVRIEPTRTNVTAEEFAVIFFDRWYCENGLPLDIVSDRDTKFMSKFWKALHRLTGVKLKMSTSYHPETDGASERTNKTVNQILRFHVDRNQSGWVRSLPRVRFAIMNTINRSTGYSPFQLRMGRSPRVLPPLTMDAAKEESKIPEGFQAVEMFRQLELDVMDAQDRLLAAKVNQAHYANQDRGAEVKYEVGDLVLMSTENRRRAYKSKGDGRVAKFMPRFDGPYEVTEAHPDSSTYSLKLPFSDVKVDGFHSKLLKLWKPNNPLLFPDRQLPEPGPTLNTDGEPEWLVEKIVDQRKRGKGHQYLVRYVGYGPEDDRWLPGAELDELEAMDKWLEEHPQT
jgi:hypothetical protein